MAINNVVQEINVLAEVVDGCKATGHYTTMAIDIYCQRAREYKFMKQFPSLYNIDGCSELEYIMSFVRDYIWFGDENRGN
jgi:hypothetical protein